MKKKLTCSLLALTFAFNVAPISECMVYAQDDEIVTYADSTKVTVSGTITTRVSEKAEAFATAMSGLDESNKTLCFVNSTDTDDKVEVALAVSGNTVSFSDAELTVGTKYSVFCNVNLLSTGFQGSTFYTPTTGDTTQNFSSVEFHTDFDTKLIIGDGTTSQTTLYEAVVEGNKETDDSNKPRLKITYDNTSTTYRYFDTTSPSTVAVDGSIAVGQDYTITLENLSGYSIIDNSFNVAIDGTMPASISLSKTATALDAPENKPTLTVEDNKITVAYTETTDEQSYTNTTLEYAVSTSTDAPTDGWSKSPVFEGLSNGTYYAYVRWSANDSTNSDSVATKSEGTVIVNTSGQAQTGDKVTYTVNVTGLDDLGENGYFINVKENYGSNVKNEDFTDLTSISIDVELEVGTVYIATVGTQALPYKEYIAFYFEAIDTGADGIETLTLVHPGGTDKLTNSHTITFDIDGDTSTTAQTSSYGDGRVGYYAMPANPTKESVVEGNVITVYTFKEWNTAADGTGSTFTMTSTSYKDRTVYAIWEVDSYSVHTITVDIDGDTTTAYTDKDGKVSLTTPTKDDTVLDEEIVEKDESFTTKKTTKTVYTFKEWNTSSDGKGDTVTSSTVFDKDTTIYAIWTEEETVVTSVVVNVKDSVTTGADGSANIEISLPDISNLDEGVEIEPVTIDYSEKDGLDDIGSVTLTSNTISSIQAFVEAGGTVEIIVPTNSDTNTLDTTIGTNLIENVETEVVWSFGSAVTNLSTTLNLAVSLFDVVDSSSSIATVIKNVVSGDYDNLDTTIGLINFSHEGNLADGETVNVKINVNDLEITLPSTGNTTAFLYKLKNGAFVDVNNPILASIDSKGILSVDMTSCSDYIITTSNIIDSSVTDPSPSTTVTTPSVSNSSGNTYNSGSGSFYNYSGSVAVNGTIISEFRSILAGEMVNLNRITTVNGEEVIGWYYDAAFTQPVENTSTFVFSEDIINNGLYAKTTGTVSSTLPDGSYNAGAGGVVSGAVTGSTNTTYTPSAVPSTIAKMLSKLF